MTPEEQRAVLDGRLQVAMAEFDDMLLEKQQTLEEKQREDPVPARQDPTAQGGGGGAGSQATAGSGQEGAAGEPGRGHEAAVSGGGQTGDASTGGSRDAGGLEEGQATAGGVQGEASRDDPRVPKDVGDGKDDDVVARQLREAAMKEDDPELREKLWDEYREYKKSVAQ
jgi:hypothetical protein